MIDNGAVSVCISSCKVDPHDLTRIARAAMARRRRRRSTVLDPDADGDVDSPAAETAPTSPHGRRVPP